MPLDHLTELRRTISTLRSQAAALERALRRRPDRPSVKAVNKLQAVLGEIEIASLLARQVVNDVHQFLTLPGSSPAEERLSAREREVLGLLAAGSTVSEVAARLALNVRTVSTYRVRILRKLELGTTAQLVRYGITHRIDGPPM
jgi:DNA-binding NarL/FixJ family response regulator